MNMDSLTIMVVQLSERVNQIELNKNFYWIPVVISIVAVIVSIINTIYYRKRSEAQELQGVKKSIDNAKAQLETQSMELSYIKAKDSRTVDEEREFELKLQVYNSVLERLLNSYNNGCSKFYKKQINQHDFIELYHQDIRDWIENVPDKFSKPLTRFDKMIKYYEEHHKNIKA